MIYRSYTAADFNALYAVEQACFILPLRFDRRYMRQLVSNSNAATWIAEKDGQLVGFGVAHHSKSREATIAYLETIEVLPTFRFRGVAGQLLTQIEQAVRKVGATTLWLHVDDKNDSAIRLYQRNGYEAIGREEKFYPNGNAAIVYRKRLLPTDSQVADNNS